MKIIISNRYKEAEQKPNLDAKSRIRINADFNAAGLDGNGRFPEADGGISPIWEVLSKYDLVLADAVTKDLFMGEQGNRKLRVQRGGPDTNDPFMPGADIENSFITYTWYELSPGKFEILAYLS